MIEFNKPDDGYASFVQHMLLSQMGVNKGIKVFGQKVINAVSKDMQHFHDREVIIPKNHIQDICGIAKPFCIIGEGHGLKMTYIGGIIFS